MQEELEDLLETEIEDEVEYRNRKRLPEDEDKFVDDVLGGEEDESEVLCQKYNVDITRGVLQCLQPLQWLNDEVK